MRQKGHTPVEYITTFAIGLLLQGKARLLPRREPALQSIHLVESGTLQETRGAAAARSARRGEDDGLVLVLDDLLHALGQLLHRNVPGARQVSGGVFLRVAHVEDERR